MTDHHEGFDREFDNLRFSDRTIDQASKVLGIDAALDEQFGAAPHEQPLNLQ